MREGSPEAGVVLAVCYDNMVASRMLRIEFALLGHLFLTMAMAINVFPCLGVDVRKLIGGNANNLAIDFVEIPHVMSLATMDKG